MERIFKAISCNSCADWTPVDQVGPEYEMAVIMSSDFCHTVISYTYNCHINI
jgi:hypothetical protein